MYALLIALIYISKLITDKIPRLSDDKRKLWFVGLSFFFMFFLIAFRDVSVGTDMANYLEKFTLLRHESWGNLLTHFYSERVEIGFALLNKLLGLFTWHPQAIIIASALLFCTGCAAFVYRYVDDALTTIIVLTCCGFYMSAFNVTRQMIAVALLINAWGLLTEKRYKGSISLFVISMLFHVTSFVFGLAYLFYFFRHNKRAVTIIVAAGTLLAALHRPLLHLASLITDKFVYLDNSKKKIHAGGIWVVWGIELAIVVLYLIYYYTKNTRYFDRLQKKLPHPVGELTPITSLCVPVFSALYVIFSFLGTSFNYLDRFGIYFLPFCALLFVDFGKRLREQSVLLARVYLVGLHACFVTYFVLFATNLPHYTYSFMW